MAIDNIDRFGFCVLCHKNLITERVVDNQVIKMFLPIHGHADFMLDNGSIMKVCICNPCKESVDLNDEQIHKNIMEAVQKGWELETKALIADNNYPDWNEESGKAYLERMSKLNIDCNSDNMNQSEITDRRRELLNELSNNT